VKKPPWVVPLPPIPFFFQKPFPFFPFSFPPSFFPLHSAEDAGIAGRKRVIGRFLPSPASLSLFSSSPFFFSFLFSQEGDGHQGKRRSRRTLRCSGFPLPKHSFLLPPPLFIFCRDAREDIRNIRAAGLLHVPPFSVPFLSFYLFPFACHAELEQVKPGGQRMLFPPFSSGTSFPPPLFG